MVKNFLIVIKNLQGTIKPASKRAIQKTAEATGNLIGNKVANKFTSVPKKSQRSRTQKIMMLIVK